MESPSVDGTYKFGMQFFDGAEHEVTVEAVDAANGSIIAEQKYIVEVEAFNPPAGVKFKTLGFLLAVIATGATPSRGARNAKTGERAKSRHLALAHLIEDVDGMRRHADKECRAGGDDAVDQTVLARQVVQQRVRRRPRAP